MRIMTLLAIALLLIASCEDQPFSHRVDESSITIVDDPFDTLEDTVIVEPSPYVVTIETKEDVIQGGFVTVDVQLTTQEATIGGFDFLISYNQSALTFQGAVADGSILYDSCNWEYFTYRLGPFVGCDGNCPAGLLRVVGIAETNNGDNHPVSPCIADSTTMFSLKFIVSNDRDLVWSWNPIRFFWIDCGDNSIASPTGDTLYNSKSVVDFQPRIHRYFDFVPLAPDSVLPTYFGSTRACDPSDSSEIYRAIDFYNGGVKIVGPDEFVAYQGDLNLDRQDYTTADAVMFSNYFIEDTLALVYVAEQNQYGQVPGYQYSIEASDVNYERPPLQVADMVLLIKILLRNFQPWELPIPVVDANLNLAENGTISVDKPMGAAFLKFTGEITPTLLANNMEMKQGFDGVYTRVLVWSIEGNSFIGDFLLAEGDLASVEMATPEAYLVNVLYTPSQVMLHQNAPNPFSDKTIIRFALPEELECTIKIYSLATDELVARHQSTFAAGYSAVQWDATGNNPGEYEFELTAGESVRSITMTLED